MPSGRARSSNDAPVERPREIAKPTDGHAQALFAQPHEANDRRARAEQVECCPLGAILVSGMSTPSPGLRMDRIQDKIATWLSRPTPGRSIGECFELPVCLATDVGSQRNENQDRVAALRLSYNNGQQRMLIAVAVADGMGGMRDGAQCANIALSSFFSALVANHRSPLQERAARAIDRANESVFAFANGNGGATLSALLFTEDSQPLIVHIGDSRVYSVNKDTAIKRLTCDDSLAEAVGGDDRGLLQFAGMGEGLKPHIIEPKDFVQTLVITTDGMHFLEPQTFDAIIVNAPDNKSICERLATTASWCGGPDNASIATIDMSAILGHSNQKSSPGIQIWDAFGSLALVSIRDEREHDDGRASDRHAAVPFREQEAATPHSAAPKRQGQRKRRNPKKAQAEHGSMAADEEVQLEIEIGNATDADGSDENSK